METQAEGVFPKVLVFYMTRESTSLLMPGVTEVKNLEVLWGRREGEREIREKVSGQELCVERRNSW